MACRIGHAVIKFAIYDGPKLCKLEETILHIEDATAFLVDYICGPRPSNGYPTYGYEIYLPNVVASYVVEVERSADHLSTIYGGRRMRELSPVFYEAAWDLSRRGILRPGVKEIGAQSAGGEGEGYCVTTMGRKWLASAAETFVLLDTTRLSHAFQGLSERLGSGFLQRASEATGCHRLGLHLACCAMCGAAAESILLAIAVAKSGDEAATLRVYQAAQGRRKITDEIVGASRAALAGPFRSATGLLGYWRDDAAHGIASNISEIEAHEALSRLLRFAQFTNDNWAELTA
jgi:hypothetical protein